MNARVDDLEIASLWVDKFEWCIRQFGPMGSSGWQTTAGLGFVFDDPDNELLFILRWGSNE